MSDLSNYVEENKNVLGKNLTKELEDLLDRHKQDVEKVNAAASGIYNSLKRLVDGVGFDLREKTDERMGRLVDDIWALKEAEIRVFLAKKTVLISIDSIINPEKSSQGLPGRASPAKAPEKDSKQRSTNSTESPSGSITPSSGKAVQTSQQKTNRTP